MHGLFRFDRATGKKACNMVEIYLAGTPQLVGQQTFVKEVLGSIHADS